MNKVNVSSPKAIVLDESAVHLFSRGGPMPEEWFDDVQHGDIPVASLNVFEIVYLFGGNATQNSRLVVVPIKDRSFLGELPCECRSEAFDRIIKAALSQFETTVRISSNWKPFHSGSRISFQSNARNTGCKSRILVEANPKGSKNLVFEIIEESVKDLSDAQLQWEVYDEAVTHFGAALDAFSAKANTRSSTGPKYSIDLEDAISNDLTSGTSLSDWYDSKLTVQQRRFVDFPLDRSVRLRGPAGTGKTLALAVKYVRALYDAIDTGEKKSFLFLTHSTATVDVVRRLIDNLDERGILHSDQLVRWEVTTLQQLANDAMSYDLSGLTPLSNDGLEGRRLQLEAIEAVVREYRLADWPLLRASCTDEFRGLMESDSGSNVHRFFCWGLMNEFACVLDADGVRESVAKRKRYLSADRRKWMMPLSNKQEKQVVLDLYSGFRKFLSEMKTIGVDQMMADYLGYLDSFRWDNIRRNEGYEAIFVDELHLFNRQERMVFQFLNRDNQKTPVVVMAHDAKQSPRDTFVDLGSGETDRGSLWKDAGLGTVEKIELREVFRYTPEIAEFLSAIDSVFPGVDFDEEWPAYSGITQTSNGPKPIFCELKNVLETYNTVFEKASRWVRRVGAGRKVAVLTISEDLFEKYLNAGAHKKNYVAIASRDELESIRYAGKRFVFSRPEYVAGLQFDVVLLIDVNRDEVSEDETALGAKRRFVSEIYLGASRAERILEVYAQKERGGLSEVLNTAIESGAINKLSVKDAKTYFAQ